MNKDELEKYLPPERSNSGGALQAAKLHFVQGYSVAQAATKSGISRQAANTMIRKIADQLEEDGYVRTEVRKFVWLKK